MPALEVGREPLQLDPIGDAVFAQQIFVDLGRVDRNTVPCLPARDAFDQIPFGAAVFRQFRNDYRHVERSLHRGGRFRAALRLSRSFAPRGHRGRRASLGAGR